ncbi:MAG: MoaD/ThiS family protein [Syntrophales bacterium]|nr:MoaD/ThiS family protein [Syntrophales bacterium]
MKITVKLVGPFVYQAGFGEKIFDVSEPATLEEILGRIRIRRDRPWIVTRNGGAIRPLDPLRDGDRIVIAPVYSGG